ncbi:MAG: Ig-like domain-containing protein, partial [Gemmatimonadota bacterium]
MPGFSGRARVRFDEPISNARGLERQIFASPAYRYRFDPGRSQIGLRPADGWRDGVVYFVRIPAGVRDLLGNRTEDPIELLFSTGPPVPATRAEGRLTDRVTGRGVREGRVLFLTDDSVPYTAVSDTGGRFSLPSLPPGAYLAFGFVDRNRNLRLDRVFEPHDSAELRLESESSVATLELRLTEPDTTPPVMLSVTAADSLTLRLGFDDYLDADQPPGATVEVRDSVSGRLWPVARAYVGEPTRPPGAEGEEGEEQPEEAPPGREGPVEGDVHGEGEVEGEVRAEDRRERGGEPTEDRGRRGALASGEAALPSQRVTVELGEALRPSRYWVRSTGFRNLRGLEGGGDTTFVYTAPGDTTGAQDAAPTDTT